jgi:membrane fusion protein, copper/silver efflux system
MKRTLNVRIFPAVLLSLLFLVMACGDRRHTGEQHRYTCPMHPEIIRNEPGTCPICKMDLVTHGAADSGSADTMAALSAHAEKISREGISTIRAQRGAKPRMINAEGVLSYDPNLRNAVSSRVSGRIEKLYVRYNFQYVRRGEKLLEIYSPDLASAQQELLYLSRSGDNRLLESAKAKLRILGMGNAAIASVLATGAVRYTVPVFSAVSGYVISEGEAASAPLPPQSAAQQDDMGMGAESPSVPAPQAPGMNTQVLLREGQYVSAGQQLFSISETSRLRAEIFIDPSLIDAFPKGTTVKIRSAASAGRQSEARISFVQPYYDQEQPFAVAKATLDNPGGRWKVGELIRATISNGVQQGTWLPATAVLALGRRHVVFRKSGNDFVPQFVQVRMVATGWADIGDSMPSGTVVARNAWFLADPEGLLKSVKL